MLFHCKVRVVGSSKFMYDQLLAIDSFFGHDFGTRIGLYGEKACGSNGGQKKSPK